jgi:branched-chain amino acid transport system ATP-binding protein
MTAILQVQRLRKSFGGLAALDGLDLHVDEGEIVSVIGPNGAGKSTLFNVITGLYEPDEGDVRFRGDSLIGRRPNQIVKLGIARTFQNVKLFPNMTILENAMVGQHTRSAAGVFGSILRIPNVRREERRIRERAREALGFFGTRLVGYREEQAAFMLSYANRRRLEVARHGPPDRSVGRADGRDEPARNARAARSHREDARRARDHGARDRARHAGREGRLRPRRRVRLRAQDRRGHVRRRGERSPGRRGLPRAPARGRRMSRDGRAAPILELRDVSTHYGLVSVLRNVDMQIFEGEMVCLLGGNASGKSTTLKTILGYVKPSKGEVMFHGEAVSGMPTTEIVQRGISMVPENRRLFPDMTVDENLQLGAYLRTDHEAIDHDREQVLETFPRIQERLKQKAGTLSGGEQQMVAMGRALMANPKLLLMDEPSMGLAPVLVEQVFGIIERIRALGKTVFVVEQNANMALSIADRGYVIQTGQVVLADTAKNLLANPLMREAYLGEL